MEKTIDFNLMCYIKPRGWIHQYTIFTCNSGDCGEYEKEALAHVEYVEKLNPCFDFKLEKQMSNTQTILVHQTKRGE